MSVLIQLNLSTGEWFIKKEQPEPFYSFVEIGFTADSLPVTFDDLAFGFSAKVNQETPQRYSYPQNDIKYVSTDQEYLVSESIQGNPEDIVTVDVWAKNAGERYFGSFGFVMPKPESPYPSWVWNEEHVAWIAPVEYPEEVSPTGNGYVWDEESLSWIPEVLDNN
jgi:hypothetical protein